jgi:hypothetical protein
MIIISNGNADVAIPTVRNLLLPIAGPVADINDP